MLTAPTAIPPMVSPRTSPSVDPLDLSIGVVSGMTVILYVDVHCCVVKLNTPGSGL